MITSENIKEVFGSLTKEEITEAIDGPGDYVCLEMHVFNTGWFATVETFNAEDELRVLESRPGALFLDKDDFHRLMEENKITTENN